MPYLPRPMTPEQADAAARRNALVEGWIAQFPLLCRVLMKAFPGVYYQALHRGFSEGEIEQACRYGAVRASVVFDPSRGRAFSTLATYYLRNEVQQMMRWEQEYAIRGGSRVDAEAIAAPEPEDWTGPNERVLEILRRRVKSPLRQKAVCLRWGLLGGNPLSLTEVGKRLGRSRERVRQMEEEVVGLCGDALREALV